MKRIITFLAAMALLSTSQAQINFRDMRVEGRWHAADGTSETWLNLYPNGTFEARVDHFDVGSVWASGVYQTRLETVMYRPMQVVTMRVNSWRTSGDATAPNQIVRLAFIADAPPILTDFQSVNFYPVGDSNGPYRALPTYRTIYR
jgi:hypothetical protein